MSNIHTKLKQIIETIPEFGPFHNADVDRVTAEILTCIWENLPEKEMMQKPGDDLWTWNDYYAAVQELLKAKS